MNTPNSCGGNDNTSKSLINLKSVITDDQTDIDCQ